MATSPYISLIFVNYHSAWQLSLALKSLFFHETERELFEIIVVNNDPEERIFLENLQRMVPFELIHAGRNCGFSAAANIGEMRARGVLLGFINPDIVWCKESLRKISELFLYDKYLGVFGMTLLDGNEKYEEWSGGRLPNLWRLILNNITPHFMRQVSHEIGKMEWVSGGGFFITRSLFEKMNGFDERFFLYFEDVDMCLRVQAAGLEVRRDPYIPLRHIGGKSSTSLAIQKSYFYSSQKLFFKKNRPQYESMTLSILHTVRSMIN